MAIRIDADARITDRRPDEDVYLPGPTPEDEAEGPFPFTYPRVGSLISAQRRLKDMSQVEAASAELDSMLDWVRDGFAPDAWEHIDARVNDPADLLDHEHLVKLYYLLNENSTGRPTSSSSGASRQPWKKPSMAAPSQQVSDSGN